MEQEVSSVIHLSTALIVLSAVIAIAMFTVTIGLEFEQSTFDSMSDLQSSMSRGQLQSVLNKDNVIMPTSALYGILCQEHSAVSYLSYTYYEDDLPTTLIVQPDQMGWVLSVNGVVDSTALFLYPEDILNDKLNGKVTLSVTADGYGSYKVIAEELER